MLKEMVKSSNMQAKAKDIDISRLQKRLQRSERGGGSSYGRGRSSHEETTPPSRQSKIAGARSPLNGVDDVIQERDAMLEQTGNYEHTMPNQPQSPARLPKMTKTRQQEWEEAVELDRMLEKERREMSIKKLESA